MNDFLYGMEKVNIKKIVIFSSIILIALAIIVFLFLKFKNHTVEEELSKGIEVKSTSTVFYSDDKSISLELANTLNLEKTSSDYLLSLTSEDNLNILISKKDVLENKILSEVANADKEVFLETFTNTTNISDVKDILVGENPASLYSFQYLDKTMNIPFNLQIVWMQVDNSYYIFDIEHPLDDSTFYPNIVSDVLTSFRIH